MRIGMFGTGAYGLALSSVLFDNRHEITLWTKFEDEADNLIKKRCNNKLLPNYKLDEIINHDSSSNTSSFCK